MARPNFENLVVHPLAERIADQVWVMVSGWDSLARHRVGGPLVEAVDSIGANIAERCGRG